MVGEEATVNESIIPGILIGVIVAVAAGCVSHVLRKREMQDLWAEEERRRKSDRRREIYEDDLRIVADSMHALTEAMSKGRRERELGSLRILEAYEAMLKCRVVVDSLQDAELTKRFQQTVDAYTVWCDSIDLATGNAKDEDKVAESAGRTQGAASATLRRIREILEEI